jgi:ACT domain-containing protein
MTLENVDLNKINQQITLESRFNIDLKSNKSGKQTSISDYVQKDITLTKKSR